MDPYGSSPDSSQDSSLKGRLSDLIPSAVLNPVEVTARAPRQLRRRGATRASFYKNNLSYAGIFEDEDGK